VAGGNPGQEPPEVTWPPPELDVGAEEGCRLPEPDWPELELPDPLEPDEPDEDLPVLEPEPLFFAAPPELPEPCWDVVPCEAWLFGVEDEAVAAPGRT